MDVYDTNNVFAKIIRGEVFCNKVLESKHSLAFDDITPITPVHILVIPKGKYITFDDMIKKASEVEIIDFQQTINLVLLKKNLIIDGYRLIMNSRNHGNQKVLHLHCHILGGDYLGEDLIVNNESNRKSAC